MASLSPFNGWFHSLKPQWSRFDEPINWCAYQESANLSAQSCWFSVGGGGGAFLFLARTNTSLVDGRFGALSQKTPTGRAGDPPFCLAIRGIPQGSEPIFVIKSRGHHYEEGNRRRGRPHLFSWEVKGTPSFFVFPLACALCLKGLPKHRSHSLCCYKPHHKLKPKDRTLLSFGVPLPETTFLPLSGSFLRRIPDCTKKQTNRDPKGHHPCFEQMICV